METKGREISSFIESLAPAYLAEDWDNVGLLLGSGNNTVRKVMVCLDITSEVANEAVNNKVDLIVSHHPLIFKGIKKIQQDDLKGKIIYTLITNNISVFSAHTNLDTAEGGVNDMLANSIGLIDVKNLKEHLAEKLFKIVVFIPEESLELVRNAMTEAGAGWLGNYSDCTFVTKGIGTFKPLAGTNPYIGQIGSIEQVDEVRLETIVAQSKLKKVLDAMIKSHPYEEVAYDLYPLEKKGKEYGLGKVGALVKPMSLSEFIALVKNNLEVEKIRLIGTTEKEIKKVAVFCGSFDEDYESVLKSKVDILLTSDIKYHAAVDMRALGMCVIDAGHFNTEKIMVPNLIKLIQKEFPQIEVIGSLVEEDPFKIT